MGSEMCIRDRIQDQKCNLHVRVSNQNGSKVIEKDLSFFPEQELDALSSFKRDLLKDGAQELIQT